jgi:Nif-specific regulatory protein
MDSQPPKINDGLLSAPAKSTSPVESSLENREAGLVNLFLTVSGLMANQGGLKSAMESILSFMLYGLGVKKAAVQLLERSSGKLILNLSQSQTKEKWVQGFDSAIIDEVLKNGQPIVIGRFENDPFFSQQSNNDPQDSDRSFVCIPITLRGQILGCLSSQGYFQDSIAFHDHLDILSVISNISANFIALHLLETIDKANLERKIQSLSAEIKHLRRRSHPANLVGASKVMQDLYYLIKKVASKKTTVLLIGESGVGKTTVANSLHYGSNNAFGPIVKIKCAELTQAYAEKDLFGHENGTLQPHLEKGLLEEADGGTIFFDDISELPLRLQPKLLRVLKEKTFERVEGETPINLNVRVIAATNKDLAQMVAKGQFMEELYYSLSVFPITIAPLRERESDVLMLAKHFLNLYSQDCGKKITTIAPQATKLLLAYDWPGNVRELENVIHRGVILSEGESLQTHDLPLSLTLPGLGKPNYGLDARLTNYERGLLIDALRHYCGNVSKAARDLGLTRRSMGLRMKRLNLDYRDFRPDKPSPHEPKQTDSDRL